MNTLEFANRINRLISGVVIRVRRKLTERKLSLINLFLLSVFVIGVAISLWLSPNMILRLDWRIVLVVTFLLAPITLLLNGLRFFEVAYLNRTPLSIRSAIKLSVLGQTFSLIPGPGGFLFKTMALVNEDRRISSAAISNILSSINWLGITLLIGSPLLWTAYHLVSVSGLIAGCVLLFGSIIAFRCSDGSRSAAAARLCLWNALAFLAHALRLFLILIGMELTHQFSDALVVSMSAAFGVLAGITTGGAGATELIASALSVATTVPAEVAFFITAANRLLTYLLIAIALVAIMISSRFKEKQQCANRSM